MLSLIITYMLLNMLSKAVNAKPVASIDFILTIDKSRLLFFNFSSSLSIFFLCCLSNESPRVSFRFSTVDEKLIRPMSMYKNHLLTLFALLFDFCLQFLELVRPVDKYPSQT